MDLTHKHIKVEKSMKNNNNNNCVKNAEINPNYYLHLQRDGSDGIGLPLDPGADGVGFGGEGLP